MKLNLLKKKDFSLLMMGKFVSLIGTQMQEFALSLYVLKITGSATLFATVIIVSLMPQLILSPLAGVFADRLDRKKIIVNLDFLSGITVTVFSLLYFANGKLSLFSIYALVILLSLFSVLYQPAIGTIIPMITEKKDLVDANGISSIIMNIGNLVSPVVAGILFGFYGLFAILIINSISFLMAALIELWITIPKNDSKAEKLQLATLRKDFMEGIQFIKEKKMLLTIIILAPILNFVLSPLFSIGFIYITKKILLVSDLQYGMMQMFVTASMLSSPFIASRMAKKYPLGKILFYNILISSLFVVLMSVIPSPLFLKLFSSNFIPYICMIVVSIIVVSVLTSCNIALSAMFQEVVPLPMMGRVGSVLNACCMASMPLGQAIFGALFDAVSTWICIIIAAIILLITILVMKNALIQSEKNLTPVPVNEL